jgi:hypothetical protein
MSPNPGRLRQHRSEACGARSAQADAVQWGAVQ